MVTLIRKDAWKLSTIATWETTLLWYAKAVGEMSTRPASDPTSWRFQGGVHGYNTSSDPFAGAGSFPRKATQRKFWNKCQHCCWFFLPWHRMYLGFYEQIVRAAVVKLGGPADWTLPYWNYSDTSNPNARALPPAFRQQKLPDGSPNPLFQIQGEGILRAPAINAGSVSAVPANDVKLSNSLAEGFYSPSTDITVGDLGFGGPAMGANHDGQFFGVKSVENVPHNAIHMDVGGAQTLGWMTNPDTAALDPIFWLHHANIDRLWSVWNNISSAHTNPTAPVNVGGRKITWATSLKFAFNNAAGKVVTMKPSQVVDTTTSPFAYDYDDTSSPLAIHATAAATERKVMKPQPRPEMVGASSKKIALTGSALTTAFKIRQPSGPARVRGEAAMAAVSARTYLHIENVISKQSHTTYEVYVNLPERPDPAAYQEHYAGAMHLFGVRHASKRSSEHSGSGLSFSLDITDLEAALRAKNAWDDKNIRVTFSPRGPEGEVNRAVAKDDPIKIGRVSLYRA